MSFFVRTQALRARLAYDPQTRRPAPTFDDAIDLVARIDREIHSAEVDDLETLARRVVATMGQALRCIGGALFLVDEEAAVLMPFVYSSISVFIDKVIPLLSKPFTEYRFDLKTPCTLTARTVTERRTFVGHDYAEFVAPTLAEPLARRIQRVVRMRTVATAPAIVGDRTLGVLMVGFREKELHPGRLRLLELFANQCAVAIHNAQRREEDLRRFERERELTVRLRAADKMKSDLLLMAGHELRTPLAAVRYGLEGLALSPGLVADPSCSRTAERLVRQIDQLNSLVDDMCDALKASQDKLELTGTPLRVDALMRNLIERRSSEFLESHVTVTCGECFDGEAPRILGDEARIRYALWEIITNAIKHGGEGVEIEINMMRELSRGRDGVRIDVRNTGRGITRALRDRLFGERFVVAPELDHKSTPGMGIGLYLVNKIVELHGGTIAIASTSNKHTTVSLWFPALTLTPGRSR